MKRAHRFRGLRLGPQTNVDVYHHETNGITLRAGLRPGLANRRLEWRGRNQSASDPRACDCQLEGEECAME